MIMPLNSATPNGNIIIYKTFLHAEKAKVKEQNSGFDEKKLYLPS